MGLGPALAFWRCVSGRAWAQLGNVSASVRTLSTLEPSLRFGCSSKFPVSPNSPGRLKLHGCCHRQGFQGGGRLFVGGLEAAENVNLGWVTGIDMIVDCRGPDSQNYDCHKRPHVLGECPPGVAKLFHGATPCTQRVDIGAMRRSLRRLMEALGQGASILVFCLNGKNRSIQTATFLLASALGDWAKATASVWTRRRPADYSSLPGRPG